MNDLAEKAMELLNNPSDTKRQIDEFSKTIQGSPKAMVEQKLASGEISQSQYNMVSKFANLILRLYNQ